MVASTLRAGSIALVSYATDDTTTADDDILRFVVLAPAGSGTVIHFTDRAWTPRAGSTMLNDGSFAAAGGNEGTYTLTVGSDLAVGDVITITTAQLTAAGINLSDSAGETLYVYQGTDANTPTEFLFAADIADGNLTFNGSLVNTGLAENAGTAIAVGHDNASFAGHATGSSQHQLQEIADEANNWHGSDLSDNGGTIYDDRADVSLSGPLSAPDMQLFASFAGGGQSDAFLRVDNDEASNIGTNLTRLLRDNPNFNRLEDITFDLEDGVWFAADNEGTDITRILKGNIADLLNPGATPTITVVFDYPNNAADSNDDKFIAGIELDKTANRLFFTLGDLVFGHELRSIDYNGANLRNWGLIDEVIDPSFGFAGGIEDFVIDPLHNTAYFSYVTVNAGAGQVLHNYIIKLNAVAGLSGSPNPASDHYDIVNIANAGAPPAGYAAGRLPDAEGSVRGVDIDAANNILWFTTGRLGAAGTGGVFKLDLNTLNYTEVWQQPSNNAHNTPQAFPTTLLNDIEVDTIGGRYYLTALNSTDTPASHDGSATDENGSTIWSGALGSAVGTAPTLFADAFEPTANGAATGMEINYAPTTTALASANATYTESDNNPNSPAGPALQVGGAPTINDVDTTNLKGAVVAITGFVPGDVLGFTNSGGITGSYNALTGVLTFSGSASYAQYATVLDTVTFTNAGDNPTDFGGSTSRTITFSVTDGLAHSDPATVNVAVVGINDRPVNVPGAPMTYSEDTTGLIGAAAPPPAPVNAVTGITVSDVDANPSTQDIIVTLSVSNGTLTIRTDVTGGLAAGEVTGNGTGLLTLTGTQNQINKTLGAVNNVSAANGLVYTPNANFNGADNLIITTNDAGFNGNDPGVSGSGTGTTEQDQDTKILNVTDVNDAPTVGGDGTEDSPTILEDTPYTNLNAPTVASLFGGQFLDALDDQDQGGANPTGSTGDALDGIAVVVNGSNANGNWQYWDGDSWENIGAVSLDAAKTFTAATLIRFSPTLNFNGAAPTLTVRLIETGGPAIVNAGIVDLNPAPPTTGPSAVYTTGSVTLSQAITPVNDAPVNSVGAALNVNEDSSATNVTGVSISDVDANPATDLVTVTLDVDHGTLAIQTNVVNGIVAGDIVSQDSDTIQITATINKINNTLAAPGGLTYLVDPQYNGGDTLEITTNDGGFAGLDPVPGTGGPNDEEDVDSKTINIAAVNDPIATTAPATASLAEDSVNFAVTGMSISDIDATLAPGGIYVVTLSSTQGTMTLTTLTGLTFSAGDGTSDSTMTFSGTLADINTALATASYTPTAHYNGSAQIDLQATDTFGGTVATGTGAATNDSDTIAVTVTAANDPVTTAAPATATLAEDSTDVAITGLSISDADAALAPAGVYEATLSATQGTVKLTTITGLTFSAGDGADDTTMTFSGTLADINAALATASYTPTAHYNGPAQVQLQATDTFNSVVATGTGAATNDSDTVAATVTAVNDEPAGTDDNGSTSESTPYTFLVADFVPGFSDPLDGHGFAAVKITTLPLAGTLKLNGSALNMGDSVTLAQLTAGEFTYEPAAASAGTSPSFTFQVQDNGGAPGVDLDQSPNTFTLNITSPSAPPVLDLNGGDPGTSATLAFSEGNGTTAMAPAATVTDADSTDFDGGSLTVTLTQVHSGDSIFLLDGNGIVGTPGMPNTVSYNGTQIGTYTFTQTSYVFTFDADATPAAAEALARQMAFGNQSDSMTSGDRTVTYTLADGDGASAQAVATVTVTAANDPPTVTALDTTVSGTEDVNLVFSAANANGISVADPDDTSLTVTLTVVSGRLTLSQTTGLSVTGNGTASVELTGSPTNINAALEGLVYRGNLNYFGSDTLTVEADDGDGTDSEDIFITLADEPIIHGDAGDNTLTGTPDADFFLVNQGGIDTLTGLADNDVFIFGAGLTTADKVNGNEGLDQIAIQGDYAGANALTLGADVLSIESFAILPGNDTRFGDTAGNSYDYSLTTVEANVPAGGQMVIDANRLRVGEDLVFNGSAENDGGFFIYGGLGVDTLTGGAQTDIFLFGVQGQWGGSDQIVGGGGIDQLALRGNYTITFGATQLTSIENFGLISAHDTKNPPAADFNYNLTMHNGNLAAGVLMTVDGAKLRATESLTFNGSAEANGMFRIFGGQGVDTIIGGQGNDIIIGGLGADVMHGGTGVDIFVYRTADDSTSAGRDGIQDFTQGETIDLSKIDAIEGVAHSVFDFIDADPFSGQAGELRATVFSGPIWLVEGDTDGDQLADLEFFVTVTDANPITSIDFVL